jgi:hypothetical protein
MRATLKRLGLLAALVVASANFPAKAQIISHPAHCRQWGELAMGVYARYQTKYKSVFGLLASQARDEGADARSKGWTEDNIKHLLLIIANAASGKWTDVQKFGEDEFNSCIAQWHATSTPEERAAENKDVERRNAETIAANEKNMAKVARTEICQQYQSVAIELITLHHTGTTINARPKLRPLKLMVPMDRCFVTPKRMQTIS